MADQKADAARILNALKKEGFSQVRDKSTEKETHVIGFGADGSEPDAVCRVRVKPNATQKVVDEAIEKAVKAFRK